MKTRLLMVLAAAAGAALAGGAVRGEALVDLNRAAFEGGELTAFGPRFRFDMGTKRVNWNHAKWSLLKFDTPKDLRAFGALRVAVATDRPRADTGVYLALMEADGTWYAHGWASDLTQNQNAGLARLDDFRLCEWYAPPGLGTHHDENAVFDADQVAAVAVGCVNPLGIGKVEFTLAALDLVKRDAPPPAAVKMDVTGRLLDVGGRTTIPAGIFGLYYVREKDWPQKYRLALIRGLNQFGKADPISHIQLGCWGERTWSPPRLAADWQEKMTKAAQDWAARAKALGQRSYVEFWNEPYLNWANYTRKGLTPGLYDEGRAAEGGPVHFKYVDEVVPHLKWTKRLEAVPWFWGWKPEHWRRGRDEKGRVHPGEYAPPLNIRARNAWRDSPVFPPADVKDGQKYKVAAGGKELELEAFTPWHVYDETQFTYWSGRGMVKLYVEPALAFGKALKEADPKAVYLVGWGFRPGEDHWAGWDYLYKPTLDALIAAADGLHEHDYGSDPLKLPANYEVVQAYAATKYGKRLLFANTEQSAQTDPQAYPQSAELSPEGFSDMNKYRWAARKMMHALSACPEKVFGFCHFGGQGYLSPSGEGLLFEALLNLRGKLVQIVCDDPALYAVAAVDGADPENPRPEGLPQRRELVVAVWNDDVRPRQLDLALAAPTGTTFADKHIVRRVGADPATKGPRLIEEEVERHGKPAGGKVALEPRSMVVLTLPLEGDVGGTPEVVRRQFFGKTILAAVTAAAPVRETIFLDAAALKGAKRAWVRLVAERLAEGEGAVTLNGRAYPLPSCVTPENAAWIRDVPVSAADLKESNALVFEVTAPTKAGYLLGMNSLLVESE
jgi:hypothetical protein